jgi:hypothetical protein
MALISHREPLLVKQSSEPMKSLIVYPRGGLANRLRALSSAKIFAEQTGRKLFLNWLPSDECNVEWQELFLDPFENCPLLLSSFRAGIDLYDDSVIPMSWYREIPVLTARDESDRIAVHSCRNFLPAGMNGATYMDAKSSFYKKLHPVHRVQKKIDDMQKRHFSGHDVAGVHIRRNDHLSFLRKDHMLVCPTRMFVEAMEKMLRMNPATKFFLATDDKKEERLIRLLFGKAVIVFEKKEPSRLTRKGMQDALVDWVLLSRTARMIAPYASSLSEEAGAVNRIKMEIIVKEEEL